MNDNIRNQTRLHHMLDAIYELESYLKGRTFDLYQSDSMFRHACMSQLQIIGEAANHLSVDFKASHSQVPWQSIVDLRNVMVHEYFNLDDEVIWEILEHQVPELEIVLKNILNSLQ
ncbi:DUF86 domain-containing protein [Candidatus Peregrinibacteria bacterium]|nr:MAG: DUF86 domain-containing protein [Candidatus Peregrinibacteria bacterium]